jgi:flagellar FliL protein
MDASTNPEDQASPKKSSRLPLLAGLILAIAGGAGGFMAVRSGFVGGGDESHALEVEEHLPAEEMPAAAFVPLDPMVINLPAGSDRQFLRFSAQLEVIPTYQQEVEAMRPRVVDVLNGYLRAVEPGDLESPEALSRLRAQMLRRIHVVVGDGRVRDLLIMEFVLN